MHPADLDCTQHQVLVAPAETAGNGPRLPFAYDEAHLGCARQEMHSVVSGDGARATDLFIAGRTGQRMAEVRGFQSRELMTGAENPGIQFLLSWILTFETCSPRRGFYISISSDFWLTSAH